MTPYEDESPTVMRTANGDWMGVASQPSSGWAEEQPEQIERPS